MQRTRANSSLQRSASLEVEDLSPGGVSGPQDASPAPSTLDAPSTGATSLASRINYLGGSPRGRLLAQLAAEVAAGQREREAAQAAREAPAPDAPSYSQVLSAVDQALRSAGASPVKAYSPSKLPRPSATAAGAGRGPSSAHASPSKIPRLAALPSADENAGTAAPSARISAHWQ